ncbi:MAG: energy-coupling factor ABC transporter ATP-binding protein [Clostridiales Family XIII bacterium]|jgi:energy-coupling factor transporter ATP-binding protein EcfA2|nr:energy-coupling factor ABC transporter ATP-binding protein [Clostridiales Family XIII bacterium]
MALTARALSYAYHKGGALAVDDFSADFAQGKITAVMGPNGCGKTTLSKLLVGILKPLCGEVTLNGMALPGLTLAETGRRIGLVMQQPGRQLFTTSVTEEIAFGLNCLALGQEETDGRVAKYLAYFGLQKYADRFPFELSIGEQQRLVIASVIAMQPAYLILDEPTSALDRGRKDDLRTLLRSLSADEDVGVLLISHDERFVSCCADSVIAMEKGRIL